MATTAHANGSHLVNGTVAHANLTYQKQTLLNLPGEAAAHANCTHHGNNKDTVKQTNQA